MTTILALFAIGVALLAADVFVTSFLLAVFGCLSMLGACAVVYRDYGLLSAVLAGIAASLLLAVTLYVELVLLPRSRVGRGLVVQSTSGVPAAPPANAADIVGKPAQAVTTLAPSGYVVVEGRRYEAFCQSGHAARGDPLRVTGLDSFRIIVSKEQHP
jgi:membrane-bound ClpP family serine protease